MRLTVVQTLPELEVGGVERGTLEVAAELVRRGHRSIVISSGGRLVDQLVNNGSEHIAMPIGRKSPLTLKYIPELRKLLVKEKVNILHARSRFPAWISYLAWITMNKGSKPGFVTTVHGPYSVNQYSKIMMRGQHIIAISEFIKNYIIKNYPDTDINKIEVIHRGVSSEQFSYDYQPADDWILSWRKKYPFLHGKYIVTLPARIARWKGHEDFLQILNMSVSSGLPVHGLIAGGPHPKRMPYYNQLISRARDSGIDKHITFLGHRDDLREIMAISDVVLSLAIEPEAFGRTTLESLCLGTPVIAYDHGGAAEVLQSMFPIGRIKPHDINAAVAKLEHFFSDPPVVPRYCPFTLEQMLDKTIALYENICSIKNK